MADQPRKPARPAPVLPQITPRGTNVADLSLYGLREDMRTMEQRQINDVAMLHDRIGGIEEGMENLRQEQGVMKNDVHETKSMTAELRLEVRSVLKVHEEERQHRLHLERVKTESEANVGLELVKLENTKLTTRGKVVAAIIGLIGTVVGFLSQYFI